LVAAPVVVFGAHSLSLARSNVVHPREWDLQLLSVYGHAGTGGVNFYTVDGIRAATPESTYSPVFTEDVLGAPFPYPPPTMLLMLPFGWWNIQTAAAVWYAINGIALAVSVTLLWRLFVPGSGALGLLLVMALVMSFRPMQSTIALGQWTCLVLLAVLCFWRDQGRQAVAGLWLASAFILRSFLVVLLIHPIRRRAWRTVVTAGATIAGLSLLAIAAFGATTCATYLQTLSFEFPMIVYTEAINQSLLTAILRVTGFDPTQGSPIAEPVFLVTGTVLVAVTGWLLWQLPADTDWTPGLTVSLALLLYPASVEHLSLLLLPPILSVWQRARRVGSSRAWWGMAFVTLAYTLIGIDDGHHAFFGLALTWAGLVGTGCSQLARRGHDRVPEAATR
jgi:arabinofuranan 3-O-arabinosyltransferase